MVVSRLFAYSLCLLYSLIWACWTSRSTSISFGVGSFFRGPSLPLENPAIIPNMALTSSLLSLPFYLGHFIHSE